jgi:hypothetical protein
MNKITFDQLTVGTRVRYTGDMANAEGVGEIFEVCAPNRWNYQQVNIRLDDGRVMLGIHLCAFDPAPGQRFQLLADYQAARAAAIAAMQADYEARQASRFVGRVWVNTKADRSHPYRSTTQIIACVANTAPADHWVPAEGGALALEGLVKLYRQASVDYYGHQ